MYPKSELIITDRIMFSTNQIQIDFHIVNEHPLFTDHFPGAPTLPGSYLLSYLTKILNNNWSDVKNIHEITFLNRVVPGGAYTAVAQMKDRCIKLVLLESHLKSRVASLVLRAA